MIFNGDYLDKMLKKMKNDIGIRIPVPLPVLNTKIKVHQNIDYLCFSIQLESSVAKFRAENRKLFTFSVFFFMIKNIYERAKGNKKLTWVRLDYMNKKVFSKLIINDSYLSKAKTIIVFYQK